MDKQQVDGPNIVRLMNNLRLGFSPKEKKQIRLPRRRWIVLSVVSKIRKYCPTASHKCNNVFHV
jgi:hypothetical protein